MLKDRLRFQLQIRSKSVGAKSRLEFTCEAANSAVSSEPCSHLYVVLGDNTWRDALVADDCDGIALNSSQFCHDLECAVVEPIAIAVAMRMRIVAVGWKRAIF